MRGVMGAADRAVSIARAYLTQEDPDGRIHDVSLDPRFQHRGVDLLWERSSGEVLGVEVKGDRRPKPVTYFLELVSNVEKDTPGCFLYSTADVLVYVFLSCRELHRVPLTAAREWFLPNAKTFPLKSTTTRTGAIKYTTVGAIVPTAVLQTSVPGAKRLHLGDDGKFVELATRPPRKKAAAG
jgi:hypothetical protein